MWRGCHGCSGGGSSSSTGEMTRVSHNISWRNANHYKHNLWGATVVLSHYVSEYTFQLLIPLVTLDINRFDVSQKSQWHLSHLLLDSHTLFYFRDCVKFASLSKVDVIRGDSRLTLHDRPSSTATDSASDGFSITRLFCPEKSIATREFSEILLWNYTLKYYFCTDSITYFSINH